MHEHGVIARDKSSDGSHGYVEKLGQRMACERVYLEQRAPDRPFLRRGCQIHYPQQAASRGNGLNKKRFVTRKENPPVTRCFFQTAQRLGMGKNRKHVVSF